VYYSLVATFDLIVFLLRVRVYSKKKLKIYYTHSTFIRGEHGNYEDVLYKELLDKGNSVFIIYNRDVFYGKISGVKAYNFGLVVRILEVYSSLFRLKRGQGTLKEWMILNKEVTRNMVGNEIFIPSYSNDVGLSLVFNPHRENYRLIEVQHTSVINYPPYSIESSIKLVDVFCCRDEVSKNFVNSHIFRKLSVEYCLIESSNKVVLANNGGRKEILYISSFEFSNVHPNFISYLIDFPSTYHIKVRLHPRQFQLRNIFYQTFTDLGCSFEFQETRDWFEGISTNCIVVSILSSIVEESVGLGLKTIIVDDLGAKRFDYLIDNRLCFFSNKLVDILNIP
jgi:hypothetical protein